MRIITTISGFSGQPITLASLLDEKTGILVIAKQIAYREDRPADDIALVSNLDLDQCDFLFTDKHIRSSITDYFTKAAQGAVDLDGALQRYKPDNKIEQDGVDESGRKYRIAPDIDNGQVAVLATVAFIRAQKSIGAAISVADELAEFYSVTTI